MVQKVFYDLTLELQKELDDLQSFKFDEIVSKKINFNDDPLSLIWFYACRDIMDAINKLNFKCADDLGIEGHYVNPETWILKVSKFTHSFVQWGKDVQLIVLRNAIDDFKKQIDLKKDMSRKFNYFYGEAVEIFFEVLSEMLLK